MYFYTRFLGRLLFPETIDRRIESSFRLILALSLFFPSSLTTIAQNSPDSLMREGEELVAEGKISEGIAMFRQGYHKYADANESCLGLQAMIHIGNAAIAAQSPALGIGAVDSALHIYRNKNCSIDTIYIQLLLLQGHLYSSAGKFELADSLFQSSRDLVLATDNNYFINQWYSFYGMSNMYQGKNSLAIANLRKATEAAGDRVDAESVGTDYFYLSMLYGLQQNIDSSTIALHNAIQIFTSDTTEDHSSNILACYGSLIQNFMKQHEYAVCHKVIEEVDQQWESFPIHIRQSPYGAWYLVNKLRLYVREGTDMPRAKSTLKQLEDIANNSTCEGYAFLSDMYLLTNRDSAQHYLDKASTCFKNLGPAFEHIYQSFIPNRRSNLLTAQKEFRLVLEEANRYFDLNKIEQSKSFQELKKQIRPMDVVMFTSRTEAEGGICFNEGDPDFCRIASQDVDLLDSIILAGAQSNKLSLLNVDLDLIYSSAALIKLSEYKKEPTIDNLNALLNATCRPSTFNLLEQLNKSLLSQEGSALGQLLAQEKKLAEEIENQKRAFVSTSDSTSLAVIRSTQNQLADVVNKIKSTYPDYYSTRYDHFGIDAKELQSSLKPEEIILVYMKTARHNDLIRVAIAADSIYLKTTPTSPTYAFIEQEYINRIKNRKENELTDSLSHYYLEGLPLSNYSELIVILPDVKPNFPFETLTFNGKPLLQTHGIRYWHSLAWGVHYLNNDKKEKSGEGILAASNANMQNNGSSKDSIQLLASREDFIEIPFADKEVNAINNIFKNQCTKKEHCTQSSFQDKIGSFAAIHLAMHAVVNKANPSISYLKFVEQDEDDGKLYLPEIKNLQLQADLVTLSACNTGTGDYFNGRGIASLANAFTLSGCPNTVQSLWQVNDASTAFLMEKFYKNLSDGMSKPRALQAAKRQFLDEAPAHWRHPFYYAGFVYFGDDYPLQMDFSSSQSWSKVPLILLSLLLLIFIVLRLKKRR